MTDRPAPATIGDVARRAGVSTATVSRVLAGVGNPRADLAEAVRRAADELDYRPSGVARSLRMRRTRTLGLIVTDIRNPFCPELVQAIDLAARAAGYSILLASAADDDARARHDLSLMVDSRVDGLIVGTGKLTPASWAWAATAPVPIVVVNAEPDDVPFPIVTSDNVGGIGLAIDHLAELGHRRIAYVRGRPDDSADRPRIEGVRAAWRANGGSPDGLVELPGDRQAEGGERAAATVLADHPGVTGIACYNDLTAIGVLRGLRAAGRRVPDEISVIGCDDIAAASWVVPSLTTVAQQTTEMGRLALERLVAILDDPDAAPAPDTIRLPMSLRVRESTAPPPG